MGVIKELDSFDEIKVKVVEEYVFLVKFKENVLIVVIIYVQGKVVIDIVCEKFKFEGIVGKVEKSFQV